MDLGAFCGGGLAYTGVIALVAMAGCEPESRTIAAPVLNAESQEQPLAPLYEMDNPDRIAGRYIVRFKPQTSGVQEIATAVAADHGGRVLKTLNSLKGFWGELPAEAIEGLRRNPNVAYIEADVAMPVAGVGDTTQYSAPWPLDRVDQRQLPLNGTYDYSSIGAGVHIWIVDTGVDRNEPELAGRIDETISASINGTDPYAPCYPHGTGVAVAAAGTNRGTAKGATIHSARAESPTCGDKLSTAAASAHMEFIADFSPRPAVINYSAGGPCHWLFGCGPTVDDAAKYARQRGVTVVVAAGNDGRDACDVSPAHVPELITVGASDINDARHGFSNWGSCVDLFAPVESTGGTSNAAPMVTGAAALYLQLYPTGSPTAVETAIYNKVTTGALSNIGAGSPNRLLYSKQLALGVSIFGPTTIGPMTICTWDAVLTGGQPVFQHVWRRDGEVVSTSSFYTVSGGEFANFRIEVVVTDGVGRTTGTFKDITVDPENMDLNCL